MNGTVILSLALAIAAPILIAVIASFILWKRGVAAPVPRGLYACTRCGANEIEAREIGCQRGPCPMELR